MGLEAGNIREMSLHKSAAAAYPGKQQGFVKEVIEEANMNVIVTIYGERRELR